MENPTHKDTMGRTTRQDVARLAGVSTAVVSYVMNNGPKNVSPETKKRVLKAARKLDYRPSSLARALKKGSASVLGIVVPDLSNPYYANLIDSIEAEASKKGYATVIATSRGEQSFEKNRIGELLSRNVDAILAFSIQSDSELIAVAQSGCRVVVLDRPRKLAGCKCVSSDYAKAGYMVTKHLLSHGHKSVAMLFGGTLQSNPRIQGWMEAHQEAGAQFGQIIKSDFTRESGYSATKELLEEENRPTAIFAGSDLEAIGAIRAIHEHGLRIPEDIAIASVDGTIESLYSTPQLTVAQQNPAKLARYAVLAATQPEEAEDCQLVETTLVLRNSCGCHSNDVDQAQ